MMRLKGLSNLKDQMILFVCLGYYALQVTNVLTVYAFQFNNKPIQQIQQTIYQL